MTWCLFCQAYIVTTAFESLEESYLQAAKMGVLPADESVNSASSSVVQTLPPSKKQAKQKKSASSIPVLKKPRKSVSAKTAKSKTQRAALDKKAAAERMARVRGFKKKVGTTKKQDKSQRKKH